MLNGPDLTPIETGLPALLGDLQQAIDGQAFQVPIPLLGQQLQSSQVSQVLTNLKNEVSVPLQALGASPTDTQIESALTSAFGSLIQGTISETTSPTRTEFDVKLQQSPTITAIPLAFNAGFPGLGLKSNAQVDLTVNYNFNLEFGVDSTLGFFFDTTPANQLSVGFTAAIQSGSSLTAQLGFLEGTATDHGSLFQGTFNIGFQPSNSGGLLTSANFATAQVQASLTGSATIDLLVTADFAGASWFPTLAPSSCSTRASRRQVRSRRRSAASRPWPSTTCRWT